MTEQFDSPNLVRYAYGLEGFDNARKFLQFRNHLDRLDYKNALALLNPLS